MIHDTDTERDRRLLLRIEQLRRCDNPTVDSPDAQISLLLAGLSGMAALIREQPQDAEGDRRLLLEIEGLRRCDNPTVDGPDAQISILLAGLSGLAARIDPPSTRDAIARIIDDEIWDGDGDYPLDRRRIADRRASAYARADRILHLLGDPR
jgi:hypothetical protein